MVSTECIMNSEWPHNTIILTSRYYKTMKRIRIDSTGRFCMIVITASIGFRLITLNIWILSGTNIRYTFVIYCLAVFCSKYNLFDRNAIPIFDHPLLKCHQFRVKSMRFIYIPNRTKIFIEIPVKLKHVAKVICSRKT